MTTAAHQRQTSASTPVTSTSWLALLDERAPELSDDLASFLRSVLDPHGERTAPAGLYWPGADDGLRRVYGLGGPDPTAPCQRQPPARRIAREIVSPRAART